MATADQVRELLQGGHGYESAARALGIPAGQAFMIATGAPADSSAAPPPAPPGSRPVRRGSHQDLVNPPAFTPTRSTEVMAWVRQRAARENRPAG